MSDEPHWHRGLTELACRMAVRRDLDYVSHYMAVERSLPQCDLCGARIPCFGPPPHKTAHPGPTCEQCYRGKTRAAKRVRRSMLRADYRERARHGR